MEKGFLTKIARENGHKTLYSFLKEKGFTKKEMMGIYNIDAGRRQIGVKTMLMFNKKFGMSFAVNDHVEIL